MSRRKNRRERERARKLGILEPSNLSPGSVVTQYGEDGEFRNIPRFDRETSISMISGRVSVEAAYRMISSRPLNLDRNPMVRRFVVDDLWEAGYHVFLSPTHRNRLHVSVKSRKRITDDDELRIWWESPDRVILDSLAFEIEGSDQHGQA